MNNEKLHIGSRNKRMFAVFMVFALIITTLLPSYNNAAYAETDDDIGVGTKVNLEHHHQIRYGTGDGGYSNLMEAYGIDDSLGNRYVFCTQPHMPSPPNGSYTIDKMYTSDAGTASVLRKLVYYAKGYPGWSKGKAKWFASGDWDDDAIYGIFHIAISYVTAGYDDNMKAWGGGTVKDCMYENYWAKMKEIVNDCKSDAEVADAPAGFKVFYIINSGYQNIIGGTLENGELTLVKKSANTEMTKGNTCYSIKGAEFGVYKGSTKVATLITDADGKSNIVELEAGSYTVKELKAPKGYAIEADQKITVKAGITNTVTFTDKPKNAPLDIVLVKKDAETKESAPQGMAKLSGAVYEIKFYKHTSEGKTLDRTWRVKTDENGAAKLAEEYLDTDFKNSDFYLSSSGKICFPLGTVTIQEVKAPEGYLLNDKIYTKEITEDSAGGETVSTYNVQEVTDQVKRGDLELVKVSDGDLNRLAGVPFKITSLTTGESHVIMTDKNGYASTAASWNKHTNNTNAGKTSEDGVWFGGSDPDDTKGALIYDDYEVEELRCETNEGMQLLKVKVSVYKDSVTVPLGTMTNDKIEIGTTAKDEDTDSHFGKAEGRTTIVDTVEYTGLKKGEMYRLVGTLMDRDTGKPIQNNGRDVTAEVIFRALTSSGSVDVEFIVDSSLLKGKTVVVFEDLYQQDIKLAIHADIEDEVQTVYYPEIGTTAKDSQTGTNSSNAGKTVTIEDIVHYEGLQPGKTYTLKGILMDKETGKALMIGGKQVTASEEFTADASSGDVIVKFTFDASELDGKEIVVFETLYKGKREIAVHADIKDKGQTVKFPEIKTTAKDGRDNDKKLNNEGQVTVVDTVEYEGLIEGKEYTVKGTLMDKETGKPVAIKEENVQAEAVFKAEKSDGTIDVKFTFDVTGLDGKNLVVFEKLYYADTGIEAANHEDLGDKGQTVKVKADSPLSSPKTGDDFNIALLIALMLAAGAAVTAVRIISRRKERRSKAKTK